MDYFKTDVFRPNVAAVIFNSKGQLLHCRRSNTKQTIWQFPQGGVEAGETIEQSLYRELSEETNLQRSDVKQIHSIPEWLYYRSPRRFLQKGTKQFVGQKQRWFLLQLTSKNPHIYSPEQELCAFSWVSYHYPLHTVADFKFKIYSRVLQTFLQPLQSIISRT